MASADATLLPRNNPGGLHLRKVILATFSQTPT